MSHVVPDLVQKVLKGQDPLHLLGDGSQVRHYTYGGDLAAGIVTAMEHPRPERGLQPLNATSTTVLELAEIIWRRSTATTAFRYVATSPSSTMSLPGPGDRKGGTRARLRGDDLARRDARRGDPMDPPRHGRRDDLTGPPVDRFNCAASDSSSTRPSGEPIS